jgi:hypothetical protein
VSDDQYVIPTPPEPERTQLPEHPKEHHRSTIALCVALAAAVFSGWQAWEAHQSRVELRRAAADQSKEAKEARKAADSAERRTFEIADSAEKALERTANAFETSVAEGVKTAVETRRQFELQSAPLVGITDVILFPPSGGSMTRVKYTFLNSGRTPALNFTVFQLVRLDDPRPDERWFPEIEHIAPSRLQPNVPSKQSANLTVTPRQYAAVLAGQSTLFLYLSYSYDDRFGRRHPGHSCWSYEKSKAAFVQFAPFERLN